MNLWDIILLAGAMFLTGLWIGMFICIVIDNHCERNDDLYQKIWERIEGRRK